MAPQKARNSHNTVFKRHSPQLKQLEFNINIVCMFIAFPFLIKTRLFFFGLCAIPGLSGLEKHKMYMQH